jgi:hypothetical protein
MTYRSGFFTGRQVRSLYTCSRGSGTECCTEGHYWRMTQGAEVAQRLNRSTGNMCGRLKERRASVALGMGQDEKSRVEDLNTFCLPCRASSRLLM